MTSLSPSRQKAQEIQIEVRKLKELYSAQPQERLTPASRLRTIGVHSQLRASSSAQLLDAIRSGTEANLNVSCNPAKNKACAPYHSCTGSNRPKARDVQAKPPLKTADDKNSSKGTEGLQTALTPNGRGVKSVLKPQGTTLHKTAKAETRQQRRKGESALDVLISKAEQELKQCAMRGQKDLRTNTQTQANLQDSECESFANTVREVQEQAASPTAATEEHPKLQADLEKWREFGYLLAESYDRLKETFARERSQHLQDAEIVRALKEQVAKLKTLLKHSYKENEALRSELASRETLREQYVVRNIRPDLPEEYQALQKENEKLLKLLAAVTKEKDLLDNEKLNSAKLVQQLNEKIKKLKGELIEAQSASSDNSRDKAPGFYKKLSQKHLEQCGSLAEQLICLRNDLDKSSLNCLRMQRQQSFSTDSLMATSPSHLATHKSDEDSDTPFDHPPKPLSVQPRPTPADCSLTPVVNRADRSFLQARPGEKNKDKDNERRCTLNVSDSNIVPTGPIKKLMPPKAPVIAHYHSNSKNSTEPKSSLPRDHKR